MKGPSFPSEPPPPPALLPVHVVQVVQDTLLIQGWTGDSGLTKRRVHHVYTKTDFGVDTAAKAGKVQLN